MGSKKLRRTTHPFSPPSERLPSGAVEDTPTAVNLKPQVLGLTVVGRAPMAALFET